MNGAHILSQLRNGLSHICDISTIDGCNFQSDTTHLSLFYFHPLIYFFFFSQSTPFFSRPCPFLSSCSWLLPVISPSCLLPSILSFLPFALFLRLFTFVHLHLTHLFSFVVLLILNGLCLSLFLLMRQPRSLFLIRRLLPSSTAPALSRNPCLSFGSILFIPFSFSFHSFSCSSFFVFPSAALLCLASSRQGC